MVALETFPDAETRLVRTSGTIIAGVMPTSAPATDTTSSLGSSLGRGTREDIWNMSLMQPAHCIWKGKLGRHASWVQVGKDDRFLEFPEGSSSS